MKKDEGQNAGCTTVLERRANSQLISGNPGCVADKAQEELRIKLPRLIDATSDYSTAPSHSSSNAASLSCEYAEYCGSYETLSFNVWNNDKRTSADSQRIQTDKGLNQSCSFNRWSSFNLRGYGQRNSNRRDTKDNQEVATRSYISSFQTLPVTQTSIAPSLDFQPLIANSVVEQISLRDDILPCTSLSSLTSTADKGHTHMPLTIDHAVHCIKEIEDKYLEPRLTVCDSEEDTASLNFLNCFLNHLSPRSSPLPSLHQDEECYHTEGRFQSHPESQIKDSHHLQSSEGNPPFLSLNAQKDTHILSLSPPKGERRVLTYLTKRDDCNTSLSPDWEGRGWKVAPATSSLRTEGSEDSFPHSTPLSIPRTLLQASPRRYKNWFDAAHRDSFGVSPPRFESPQNISSEVRKMYSSDSCNEGYSLESDTVSSCSSTDSFRDQNVFDSSRWSIKEALSFIRKPNFVVFESKYENLHTYLTPHNVGHISYLVKCYADAVFSISIPSGLIGAGKTLSPITCLNFHILGVFQVYYLMFKCEDFRNLTPHDQVCLLEANMIPILISLGMIFYDVKTKSWTIPFVPSNTSSKLPLCNFLQIIPEGIVHNLTVLHDVAEDLKVDETMALLFAFITIYTPVGKPVKNLDVIDKIRDKYVNILLHYLKWKFGPLNVTTLFPEILKLLDTFLKFSEEINDYKLRLSDDEIAILKYHLKFIEQQTGGVFPAEDDFEGVKDASRDKISYSFLHAKLSSVFLRLTTS